MDRKPQLSARSTYVFDEDELEKLDELSLTSVVRQVSDSVEQPEKDPQETAVEEDHGNTTINELLRKPISPSKRDSDDAKNHKPSDDLLDPELLFPEEEDDAS